MSETSPVYLHIGYMKTGTKALQRGVFPNHKRLHVWANGPLLFNTNDAVQEQAVRLLYDLARSGTWDVNGRQADELRRLAHAEDGRVSLASYETLSGGFYEPVVDGVESCRRLRELFPSSRVILVVREQRSLLRSTYAQYLRAGGTVSSRRFPMSTAFRRDRLLYDRFVGQLRAIFGTEHVKVLVYEQYLRAPDAFLAEFGRFMGIDDLASLADRSTRRENASLAPASLGVMRVVNRLFHQSNIQPKPLLPSRRLVWLSNQLLRRGLNPTIVKLAPSQARASQQTLPDAFLAEVAASNRRLADLCDLPLWEYGYLLPGPSRGAG